MILMKIIAGLRRACGLLMQRDRKDTVPMKKDIFERKGSFQRGLIITLLTICLSSVAMAESPPRSPKAARLAQPKGVIDVVETTSGNLEKLEDSVALSRPNAISLETLGRGVLYSVNYDRSLGKSVSLGAGFSYYNFVAGPAHASLLVLPLYSNLYFLSDSHRPFITGGIDIVSISGKVDELLDNQIKLSASGAVPMLGGGYEFRGQGGFLFRAALYALVGPGILPWAGLSFGAAF